MSNHLHAFQAIDFLKHPKNSILAIHAKLGVPRASDLEDTIEAAQ